MTTLGRNSNCTTLRYSCIRLLPRQIIEKHHKKYKKKVERMSPAHTSAYNSTHLLNWALPCPPAALKTDSSYFFISVNIHSILLLVFLLIQYCKQFSRAFFCNDFFLLLFLLSTLVYRMVGTMVIDMKDLSFGILLLNVFFFFYSNRSNTNFGLMYIRNILLHHMKKANEFTKMSYHQGIHRHLWTWMLFFVENPFRCSSPSHSLRSLTYFVDFFFAMIKLFPFCEEWK